MNIRLKYNSEMLGAVYYDDRLQLNNYSVNLLLITNDADNRETNIAIERLKCMLHHELQGVVWFHERHTPQARIMQDLGTRVAILPEEPVDQVIGMTLYSKLNAVMEGRVTVTNLDIASALGEWIWYSHDEAESLGPLQVPGWWNDATPSYDSNADVADSHNVVSIRQRQWHEYDLNWHNESQAEADDNRVVFTQFPRREN